MLMRSTPHSAKPRTMSTEAMRSDTITGSRVGPVIGLLNAPRFRQLRDAIDKSDDMRLTRAWCVVRGYDLGADRVEIARLRGSEKLVGFLGADAVSYTHLRAHETRH